MRSELDRMLAERPPADRAFFDLFEAVNALEQVALTWCPTLAGAPLEHPLAPWQLVLIILVADKLHGQYKQICCCLS